MADHIARSLLSAMPSRSSSASTATDLSESSQSSSAGHGGIPAAAAATGAADPLSDKVKQLEQWSDDLECQLLTGVQKFREEDPMATSSTLKEAADALHVSILDEVAPSIVGGCWEDDSEANIATLAAAESIPVDDDYTAGIAESVDLRSLASLLRATGLFMRWSAQLLQPNFVSRLKSKSMILLYSKLLATEMKVSPTSPAYPDVPRFASICLFRATYGDDAMTTTARRLFVNSLDGCSYLMKALLKGDQPVPRLFSVVRNVHHLIASTPESIPKMEKALESLTDSNDDSGNQKRGLSEVLVATLAWAFRSQPPFPGAISDRRSDLALEILRAMYVLGSNPSISMPPKDVMTQIGVILCELLQLSNADERLYQIKLAVVALLLNAPDEYINYLVNNGGIKPLVDIMAYQTSLVVVEKRGSSAEDAAAVLPILLVLLKLTQSNESALKIAKDEVFPPDAEDAFEQRAKAEIAKGESEGKVNAKNMAPLDAPKWTLRWKLIRLMTWIESNVKRSACELLWVLCDGDSTQFVLRTGFGNAVHFLGIRGFVNLPAGVEM
mmetsp:Transcript_26089/g.62657  ORF Transcript_26089/g.62657 Transcript_26089/m.62657 type:complete len:556 (-) Transcript_26089:143-1810(-)